MQCSYRPSDSIQIPDEAIHTPETLSRQTDRSVSDGYNLFTVKRRLIDPVCIQTDHFVLVQG